MNKKFKIMLLLLTLFLPCMLMLSACGKEDPKATTISVELNTAKYLLSDNTITTTYGSKVSLIPSDFIVKANMNNGSIKTLSGQDYIYASTIPSADITPVGQYSIIFSYQELEDVLINIKVEKADLDMSSLKWNYSNPFTYDGIEHEVKITDLPNGVSVTYEGVTKATNAGSYTAKANFTYSDTTNYNAIQSIEFPWVIEKANVTGFDLLSLEENQFAYTGESHTVVIKNIPTGAKIETISNNIASSAGNHKAVITLVCKDSLNYNTFDPVTKEFSWNISPAKLVVTAKDATITYGDNAYNNGYEVTGFVNGETTNVLKGSIQYSFGSYTAGSDVSTYDIVPSGIFADNYQIEFRKGTLTVNPLEIDVSAVSWPITSEYDYNGQSIKPQLLNLPENVVAEYTYSNVNPVNGGNYTVSVTLLPINNNYKLINNTVTKTFAYSIIEKQEEPELPTNMLPENIFLDITISDFTLGINDFEFKNNMYYVTFDELSIDQVKDEFNYITIGYISTDLEGATFESLEGELADVNTEFYINCEFDEFINATVGVLNITLNDGTICYLRLCFND